MVSGKDLFPLLLLAHSAECVVELCLFVSACACMLVCVCVCATVRVCMYAYVCVAGDYIPARWCKLGRF